MFIIWKRISFIDANVDSEKLNNLDRGKAANNLRDKLLLKVFENEKKQKKYLLMNARRTPVKFKTYQAASTADFCYISGKKKILEKMKGLCQHAKWNSCMGVFWHLALQIEIDMIQLIKYALTLVPLSLCNVDGSMPSEAKSTLTSNRKEFIQHPTELMSQLLV